MIERVSISRKGQINLDAWNRVGELVPRRTLFSHSKSVLFGYHFCEKLYFFNNRIAVGTKRKIRVFFDNNPDEIAEIVRFLFETENPHRIVVVSDRNLGLGETQKLGEIVVDLPFDFSGKRYSRLRSYHNEATRRFLFSSDLSLSKSIVLLWIQQVKQTWSNPWFATSFSKYKYTLLVPGIRALSLVDDNDLVHASIVYAVEGEFAYTLNIMTMRGEQYFTGAGKALMVELIKQLEREGVKKLFLGDSYNTKRIRVNLDKHIYDFKSLFGQEKLYFNHIWRRNEKDS